MIRHLAVVGATGAVGVEVLSILESKRLPIGKISLFASPRSADKVMECQGEKLRVQPLSESSFNGIEAAIFSAGAERSRVYAPIAVKSGTVVIDNSSAFRMDPDVPLVVPEINPQAIKQHKGIIANPNCSTIIMAMAVWPLHQVNRVKRMVVSTYQAASGAGAAAMDELLLQTQDHLARRPVVARVFPHPIAFNLFSHNTPIGADGYNTEERKMIDETRKIFGAPNLAITATCVRVPVLRAHSESINLTLERPMSPAEAREILAGAPGLRIVDDVSGGRFPMPIEASGLDECLVGRIRQDLSQPDGKGLELFVCGDQLRKGAALNALQILERLN